MTNQRPGNKSRGTSDDVTASVYLAMMLVNLLNYLTQTPVLHSGSRLDRQWYALRSYRPFTPPHPALRNNLYL